MTESLDTPEPTPKKRRKATAVPKKDPKSGTYTIVVDGPRDPATGTRKQLKRRGFATKKLALAELDKIRHNVREGDFVALDRTDVRKYLTAWLDSLERSGLRANTIASYRRVITHHVIPHLGSGRFSL